VRFFQTPATPGHLRLAAQLSFRTDLAGDASHFRGEGVELIDHRVDGVLQLEDFALHVDGDLLGEVAGSDGRRDQGDVAHLPGQVRGHEVHVVRQVLPDPRHAAHVGLASQAPFRTDFAGDAGDLTGERPELIDHRVDGVLERQDLAARLDGDLLREVSVRDRGGHLGDVADLIGEVSGEDVDVVRQVLPDAGDPGHLGLRAELSFRADLLGDAGHLRCERSKLVHHRVDGVLEREHLAADVDGDLLRKISVCDGGRDFCDVSNLIGKVAGEDVDVVRQVLPGARHALHVGLAAQLPVGADFLRDAGHLARERPQLIDHRVDGVLQLQHFALRANGDLPGEVSVRDRRGHFGDVADLGGEVVGEEVDVVRQVLPGTGDSGHLGLRSELSFHSHRAGDARDLLGEDGERLRHVVERLAESRDLSFRVYLQLLGEIAVRDSRHHLHDAANLGGQVRGHEVDVVGEILPDARHALHVRLPA